MEDRNPIGFVIALPLECRSLTRQRATRLATLQLSPHRWISVSGAGAANAAATAETLVARGAGRLVSWGCAGALAEHLAPGDVVVAKSIRFADGVLGSVSQAWRDQLVQSLGEAVPVDEGLLTEGRSIVASAADKRQLAITSGAVAVDMESAAVLRVAERRNVPCIAVRAIADTATTSFPETVLNALDEHGEIRFASLLLGLARKPSELVALLHLNRCFRQAIKSLKKVAELAGPVLAV